MEVFVAQIFDIVYIKSHLWSVKILNTVYSKEQIFKMCCCRKLPERQMDDRKLKTMPLIRLGQNSETFV